MALHLLAQVCDACTGLTSRARPPRRETDNISLHRSTRQADRPRSGEDVEGDLNLTKPAAPRNAALHGSEQFDEGTPTSSHLHLGATLYMMLTGPVPFSKTSPLDCWMKKIRTISRRPRKLGELSDRVTGAVWGIECRPVQAPVELPEDAGRPRPDPPLHRPGLGRWRSSERHSRRGNSRALHRVGTHRPQTAHFTRSDSSRTSSAAAGNRS